MTLVKLASLTNYFLLILIFKVQDKRIEVSAHATQIAEVALASLGVGSKAVQELPRDLHKRDLFNAMVCHSKPISGSSVYYYYYYYALFEFEFEFELTRFGLA